MARRRPVVFVGTLGAQPQVITQALDLLHTEYDHSFAEVCVIHTDERKGLIKHAVEAVDAEFKRYHQLQTGEGEKAWEAVYTYHSTYTTPNPQPSTLTYRRILIRRQVEQPARLPKYVPVGDVENEENAEAAHRTIFQVIGEYKRQNAIIHLSIAGGRKIMSVFGLAAAQTLFDYSDKVWHLVPKKEDEKSNQMHESPAKSALVPVDVIYLSEFLASKGLLFDDPYRIIEAQQKYLQGIDQERKEAFLNSLDPVDRLILVGITQLLENDEVAEQISKVPNQKKLAASTVANRLTNINNAYQAFLEQRNIFLPAKSPRLVLVAEFASYFRQRGEQLPE